MAAGRSTDPVRRPLTPGGRTVGAGAIAVGASMLLPWYGIAFTNGLSVTGFDSFGFGDAALIVTVGAAVVLVVAEAGGTVLPRPLRTAELVIAAGTWAALLCAYLMIDRPDELAGSPRIGLRLGVFVALGGSVAIVLGGLRMRAERAG